MKVFLFIFLTPFFLFAQTIYFDAEGMNLKLEKVVSSLGVVWGIDFIDKDKLIFTEKSGKIGLYNLKTKEKKYFSKVPNVLNKGQGGLLDIAISPKFQNDKTIYITYVKNINNQGATTLAKATYKNNSLEEWEDILVTKSISDTSRHFGSKIAFDEKGHLFFSVGERGVRPNAQDLSNHAGKILRLNLDGTIPKDNPYINIKNARPEIYTYGNRNPQGLFYDKKRGILFSSEHGPRGGDEINIIQAGQNYGWPVISYGKEYWNPFPVGETHKEGMIQPIKVYTPSIATSSLIVYQGDKLPKFKGDIFVGALKLTHLNRVVLNKSLKPIKEQRFFSELNERIRTIKESPDGFIYISTDSGNIYKISPAN
eukprot:TRINITY_DN22866_c0_g1_i4.p1 TRINITY_DN22866_c0_g1~~TRINITY_DN22866_c0_g1_i4.p1  ORF type:complete len:368 (+),score=44.12 TRINITY_DN22866_c0_g1_i4:275-1378(+)